MMTSEDRRDERLHRHTRVNDGIHPAHGLLRLPNPIDERIVSREDADSDRCTDQAPDREHVGVSAAFSGRWTLSGRCREVDLALSTPRKEVASEAGGSLAVLAKSLIER